MTIIWSPQAIDDLVSLRTFIAEDNPDAAQAVAQHVLASVERLLTNTPGIGRPGRVSGTRELVITKTPFIVPYRVHDESVQILRIYHQARRWPDHI